MTAQSTQHATPTSSPVIELLQQHRTIRAFTEEPLPDDVVTTLLQSALSGATSSFYQHTTILRITDPDIRHTIYESSGQPYVDGTAGTLFMCIVDLHRNAQIRQEVGVSVEPLERTALFLQGVEDTLIAAQNLVVAAESLGLGTVYLGSVGTDPRSVIRALKLPKHTYPLLGLLVGYPAQHPQLKPRLPLSFTTADNVYPAIDNMTDALRDYDDVVHTYYDLRDTGRRIDKFTDQIVRKPGSGGTETAPVLEVLHEQGLALS